MRGLTNYTWYTVTLTAESDDTPVLTSNTVSVMPVGQFVYLPIVLRAF
jgi:hypothetical protein